MEQITVPGVMARHDEVIDFLMLHANKAGLDEKVINRLHLSVDEIVTNIIIHGYEENGLTGDIVVQIDSTPEEFTVTMVDRAPPFDPRSLADPVSMTLDLEDRPIGGLGIYLMLRNVDRFDYAYADSQNHNTLAMKRCPSKA